MDKFEALAGEYVGKPYTRTLTPDGDGFTAEILELPGCLTYGDTPADAYTMLDEALALYVATLLEEGVAVPDPIGDQSGKIAVRTSSDLHRRAMLSSRKENISLNHWMALAMEGRLGSQVLGKNTGLEQVAAPDAEETHDDAPPGENS
jgi:antitoxin HicB